jgi:uncharacterized protein (TIGR01777 family)
VDIQKRNLSVIENFKTFNEVESFNFTMEQYMKPKTILIAGGTGLIGKPLVRQMEERGHQVNVLTRSPKAKNQYQWSPSAKTIDEKALQGVETIINLAGAGIADKRWTASRKKELVNSRVITAQFLYDLREKMPQLTHYISASGINCYGYEEPDRKHVETDGFGKDFLSFVVRKWEEAADLFSNEYKVAKIRTGIVLDPNGGAMEKIAKTVKSYIGAPLGTGKQWMPWLTIEDMIAIYEHAVEKGLVGRFNAVANNHSNAAFTAALAKQLNKPLILPNVPSFVLKIALGEMSSIVLDGLQASNQKIKETGFEFKYTELEKAIAACYS